MPHILNGDHPFRCFFTVLIVVVGVEKSLDLTGTNGTLQDHQGFSMRIAINNLGSVSPNG